MDGEFLEGEVRDLVLHTRACPQCDAEGAQRIEFRAGHVLRCEACGLLELTHNEEQGGAAAL